MRGYFGHLDAVDLVVLLDNVLQVFLPMQRNHRSVTLVQKQEAGIQDAMDYKGSAEEKKARLFLANLGINYDALTMEQFTNLIEVLKLSKHMNSPISQRGKGGMTHGKGKRKRK